MKIHVVSETEFVMKATGVHTAFVDHVTLLKEKGDIDVVVNNEGYGDICHGHTYGLYYFWQGRKYKGRRVFTVHVIPDSIKGSLPLWKLFMPLVRFGLKQVYSYADICIAISPEVEKAILSTGANTRIVRIYNPVHADFWKRNGELRKKGRQMLGTGENDFVVLGSGQLIGRKGIEDFIDIAAAIPEAKFVWAGGRPFGRLSEGIRRIDKKIKAASVNFSYAGNFELESMPAVYAAADLMLFPSFQENCPLAPLEAAASGIPVIFRDIEEYRSLYENPYLAAADPAEFIEITRRMIFNEDFYEKGKEISQQLIIQFDKEVIRRKLLDLYSYLLDYSGTPMDCLNTHPQLSLG